MSKKKETKILSEEEIHINLIKTELANIKPLLDAFGKRSYDNEILVNFYRIHNIVFPNENKKPQGCNSCHRTVIADLIRASNIYLTTK